MSPKQMKMLTEKNIYHANFWTAIAREAAKAGYLALKKGEADIMDGDRKPIEEGGQQYDMRYRVAASEKMVQLIQRFYKHLGVAKQQSIGEINIARL